MPVLCFKGVSGHKAGMFLRCKGKNAYLEDNKGCRYTPNKFFHNKRDFGRSWMGRYSNNARKYMCLDGQKVSRCGGEVLPVCGGGKTYSNICEAGLAGHKEVYPGSCQIIGSVNPLADLDIGDCDEENRPAPSQSDDDSDYEIGSQAPRLFSSREGTLLGQSNNSYDGPTDPQDFFYFGNLPNDTPYN